MSRIVSAMKNDVRVQVRNKLYTIGISVALILAVALSQLAGPTQLPTIVPALMLIIIGGSTLLYVAGIIIFEKEESTLHAIIVSPLRSSEYLWAKIITLTALATLESILMIGGAYLIMGYSHPISWPNIPILVFGILSIGVIYTLIGIILIVRYDRITDFLIPMAAVATILQIPFVHFWGIFEHWAFLLIPTTAPTMIIQGAFTPLAAWEWIYAISYSALLIAGLSYWAARAFHHHILLKVG